MNFSIKDGLKIVSKTKKKIVGLQKIRNYIVQKMEK